MKTKDIIAIEKVLREKKEMEEDLYASLGNELFNKYEVNTEAEISDDKQADYFYESKNYKLQGEIVEEVKNLYSSFLDHDWH